jgi:hypothetical protein
MSAADALEHPWLQTAAEVPEQQLQGSVVQRLQRFATYSFLKQLVLKIIIDDMQAQQAQGAAGAELPPMLAALQEMFNQLDVDHSGACRGAWPAAARSWPVERVCLCGWVGGWMAAAGRLPQCAPGWPAGAAGAALLGWRGLHPHNNWAFARGSGRSPASAP